MENTQFSFIKEFYRNKNNIIYWNQFANFSFLKDQNLFNYDNYYFYNSVVTDYNNEIFIIYQFSVLNAIQNYFYIILLSFSFIIFFPILIFLLVYNLFYKKRVNHLLKVSEELSKGNIDQKIVITGKDEIALISSIINKLFNDFYSIFFFDALTEILNRKGFEYKSNGLIKNHNLAILFIDLDGFKFINETFGHDVGDKALKIVALRLKRISNDNIIGNSIVLGRIGGDEFAITIAFHPSQLDELYRDIQIFALKIIDEISQKIQIENFEFYLGASIGIALSPRDGQNIYELLTSSDIAMYEAKNSTKNTYVFFNQTLKRKYESKNLLRNILFDIIKSQKLSEHFYVVFQPIYSLKEKKVTHFELLSRFYHHEIIASISEVIQILEELRFLYEFGNFILIKGLEEFLELKKILGDELKLSINISVQQMMVKNFYNNLKRIFSSYSVNNSDIIFEITESQVILHFDKIIRIMNTLIDDGFSFALDDFEDILLLST